MGAAEAAERLGAISVSSASMLPTAREGETLLVNVDAREPERGTVVAMALPRDPRVIYLRRVIGLPGDRVQMIAGVLQLNGASASVVKTDGTVPQGAVGALYRETLPDGASYVILDQSLEGMGDDTLVFEVPPAAYFVMGDNRDNAIDSRLPAANGGVGFVPADNILGEVKSVYASPDSSRVGKTIE